MLLPFFLVWKKLRLVNSDWLPRVARQRAERVRICIVDVSVHVTYVNVYVYMSEFMCAYVKIEKYKYIKYIISTYVCAFYTNQIHLYKFSIYLYFPKLYLYNA